MAILPPLWSTLKTNIVTELTAIAAEENAVSPGRNFLVQKDRWRPWIEAQQNTPLVNVMVQTVGQDSARSANRRSSMDEITINVDMYALGKGGETLPADEVAAERLDLLIAQVREGLTRLDTNDFGFTRDPITGWSIDRNINFSLTYYDQENEQASGQYAPARWSFSVNMPFIPNDKRVYNNLEELNVNVQEYALRFDYTP
jgi:hypothetical protein